MTLLTICQDAANIIGITSPSAVTASTDLSVIQLEAAVNQEGRVAAALKAKAGSRLEIQSAPRRRRAQGVEIGRLDEHVDGVAGAARVQAAHDAAQGRGPGRVGDHRHVAVERVFLVVERHQRLAGLGQAQAEIALDGVGVEDVQRPVEADSKKVGDVDQGRDWPESDG